jgi:hypothetical protein
VTHRAVRPLVLAALAVVLAVVAVLVEVVTDAQGVSAQTAPGSATTDAEQELADRYAPIMMLKAQDEACDTQGEAFAPMAVDAVLDNDQVALRQVGNLDPVVMRGPTARDLFGLGGGFYLDFPGASLSPGCLYERDFQRYTAGARPTVYAHIATQAGEPGQLALQYWTYWYYNDWNNKHESDWEFIQLVFPASTVDEALRIEPTSVGYAQHEGGERADWSSSKLEREGAHPVVYSSAGSHASYYGSALFLGRSGSEGFGCDNTDGPSTRVMPDVVVLPDSVTDPADPFAWLTFEGRWGERHDGPYNGPDGPYRKARWTKPIDWADDLRPSAVVVPTGDAQASQVVNAFCSVVEFGSVQVVKLQTSPVRVILSLAVLAWVVTFLIRHTSWASVEPLPIVKRRRAGEIARASFALLRRHPLSFLAVGLLYVPMAALAGLLAALVRFVPFFGDVVSLFDRGGGGSRLLLSLLVGGFASLLAFVIVAAAVSTLVDDVSRGERLSARRAVRRAREHIDALAVGLLRATIIVVALEISVVGIPFGIRQLVRYQLLAQTAMLEGADGRTALARSSELVRGRWFHTALFVGVVHLVTATSGFVVGLLLLVTVTSMPFWMLSVIVTVVGALVMPLGAIAVTLLYGDAVAEHDDREPDPAEMASA